MGHLSYKEQRTFGCGLLIFSFIETLT